MRNLKLTVAYDGTDYHGFQDQGDDGRPTVQRTLEKAWMKLVGEPVKVIGAGRTDAGVHALGQVVNFRTESTSIASERVPYALNSVLPEDVRVTDCEEAPLTFHARFDAVAKQYVYRIDNRPFPSPLCRRYAHHIPRALDVVAMQAAARLLIGRHDFRAFAGAPNASRTTVRCVTRCEVAEESGVVEIAIEADGFLYHMVRTIAGSLVKVGAGERPPEWIKDVLLLEGPPAGGPNPSGKGLVLMWVKYRADASRDG